MESTPERGSLTSAILRVVVVGVRIAVRVVFALLRFVVDQLGRWGAASVRWLLGSSRWTREAHATTAELCRVIDRFEAELAARDQEILRLRAMLDDRTVATDVRRLA